MSQPSVGGSGGGATVEFDFHLTRGSRGAMEIREGQAPPQPVAPVPVGSVPRVAKLMALALKIDGLVRRGEIRDYADVARLAHITRARVAQIVGLTCLAPDIIEEILHLPPTVSGRDRITERDLRPLASESDWNRQRKMWLALRSRLL